MKRENFEIKKVYSGEPNSATTRDASYEIKRNDKCILELSYEELLELTQLCKHYTDCNLPSRLLYSDEELINALKERGYEGKLTKTTNIATMTQEELKNVTDILLKDPEVVEMIRQVNVLGEEIRELKKKCQQLAHDTNVVSNIHTSDALSARISDEERLNHIERCEL